MKLVTTPLLKQKLFKSQMDWHDVYAGLTEAALKAQEARDAAGKVIKMIESGRSDKRIDAAMSKLEEAEEAALKAWSEANNDLCR